jgi:hypothetical protein
LRRSYAGVEVRRRRYPRRVRRCPPSTNECRPALIGAAACTWCAPTAAEAGARTKASAGASDRGNANGLVDKGVSRTPARFTRRLGERVLGRRERVLGKARAGPWEGLCGGTDAEASRQGVRAAWRRRSRRGASTQARSGRIQFWCAPV